MERLKSVFSNKFVLCGIGSVGAFLLWKKYQRKENETEKPRFKPLISPLIQRYFFGMTTIAWCLVLKPNIFPKASQFIATQLRALYPLLPLISLNNIINLNGLNNKNTLFGTKKRGLITVGISMSLLTAYRKIYTFRSIINKLLMNPISIRLYELLIYSMPWYVMINSTNSNNNSFNQFMAWFSMIFVTNGLSLSIGKPIFSFLKIRHIPYFSFLTYSWGLLSPSTDISKPSYMSYVVLSVISKMLFIGYKLGFDNGDIKAYSLLANILIPAPYLYFKREISLYILVFFWIPIFYYFYYVLGHAEITEIEKGVFLCNIAAIHEDTINKYKIKNIVQLRDDSQDAPKKDRFENIDYLTVEIADRSYMKINKKFDKTNKFISECVKNKSNVIVHCGAGVSRSASIVAAYLIYTGYSFDDTMKKMKHLRTSFDPNTGFLAQLQEFAETR